MDVPSFENYEPPRYTIHTKKAREKGMLNPDAVIIGATPNILALFQKVNALADLPTTILIRGETGTGKELFARALHHNGKTKRSFGNFVTVNCAGIPQELLESLLFGHVRGAFTSAYYDKRGLAEEAHEGTLFLDEIGEMTPYLQAKVLRLLQEHEITRVGDTATKRVDVRIIAATNRNLEEKMKDGSFHSDLFYRINAFPLQLTPLRKCAEDIPYLAQHFIAKYNTLYERNGICVEGASEGVLRKLEAHAWPGNVRELENVITRAMILRGRGTLQEDDIVLNDSELANKMIRAVSQTDVFTAPAYIQDGAMRALPQWCEGGVVPVLYSELKYQRGTYSDKVIRNLLAENQMYAINLRGNHRPAFVFILSQETLPKLFATSSELSTALQNKISSGEFNSIVQQPFMITSFSKLRQLGATHSYSSLRSAVNDVQPYRLSPRYSSYFVLTEQNAPDFVLSFRDRENTSDIALAKVQHEIHRQYEHFLHWQPGEPSWTAL